MPRMVAIFFLRFPMREFLIENGIIHLSLRSWLWKTTFSVHKTGAFPFYRT
jgi:hypothetical protein